MSSPEFDLMWEVLSKYSLEVTYDSHNEDLHCSLCKRIMIDAYQSICGCSYCHKCILQYLKDGEKYCPRQKLECKEKYLILEKNISKSDALNERISELEIKCRFCTLGIKLKEINEHLKLCVNTKTSSFKTEYEMTRLSNSVEVESLIHPRIMIEMINNLRNEVDGLKEKTYSNECEISTLKEILKENELEMSKLRKEIWCILYRLNDDKNRLECLEKNVQWHNEEEQINVEESTVEEMKSGKVEDERDKVIEAKEILESTQNEEEELDFEHKRDDSLVLAEISSVKKMNENINSVPIENSQNEIVRIKTEVRSHVLKTMNWLDEVDIKMTKLELKFSELRQKWMNGKKFEFIWRIDNVSVKQNRTRLGQFRDLCSDYFYTPPNGYKLKLFMYHNEYEAQKYLTIYFKLLPGIFDSILSWPFKDTLTFAVVDQKRGEDHFEYVASYNTTSDTNKYVFHKPLKKGNEGYGYDIKYADLLRTPGFIVKDTIFVKCSVTPEEVHL